jgi:hypothetical protein
MSADPEQAALIIDLVCKISGYWLRLDKPVRYWTNVDAVSVSANAAGVSIDTEAGLGTFFSPATAIFS